MLPPQWENLKIYIIVFMTAILISGFNFVRAQFIESDYKSLKKEIGNVKDQLSECEKIKSESNSMISDILTVFNRSSKNFSSNMYVIDLHVGGKDSREFTVSGGTDINRAELYWLSGNLLDTKYGARICKDVKVEAVASAQKNEAKIKVTSGSTTGYEILRFTNTVNKEDFYVLIMVSDY